jgi:multidrug resistance efflux pump
MKRATFLIPMQAALLINSALALAQTVRDSDPSRPSPVAAAPGRIEGSADPVDVGASISGVVEKVLVQQGDRISAEQVLVRISCDETAARLQQRSAESTAATALHTKLVNGPRPQEIDIAIAEVKLAEARLAEAQARIVRARALVKNNDISRAAYDTAERDNFMAESQLDSARLRLRLLEAGTRDEELAEAKARMIAAQHAVAATEAELAKCEIRSSIDGIVLRKHVSQGELVSVFYPKPLVTIVELRNYRVRAEVDEHDVNQVRVGQKVEIVLNGVSKEHLRGRVASLAPVMGRRKILTSDPADKSDRDVLEVLIDIDDQPKNMPIGLRASVIFY